MYSAMKLRWHVALYAPGCDLDLNVVAKLRRAYGLQALAAGYKEGWTDM